MTTKGARAKREYDLMGERLIILRTKSILKSNLFDDTSQRIMSI